MACPIHHCILKAVNVKDAGLDIDTFLFEILLFSLFDEFELRLKSAKNRFQLSSILTLKTLNTILSDINHIWAAAQIL